MHLCLVAQGGPLWLGGHYYLQHILRALNALPKEKTRDLRVTYLTGTNVSLPVVSYDTKTVVAPEVYNPPQSLPQKMLRRLRRARGLRNPQLHDFLVHHGVDFAYPCATGGEGAYRTAHWIADIQFKHYPQFQTVESLAGQSAYLGDIAAKANTIVLSSAYGEADCHRFYPETRGRTFVMPFRVGVDIEAESPNAPNALGLPPRFFLCSNQFWQNKNHRVVVKALARLKANGRPVNIVCTGRFHDPRLPSYTDDLLGEINAAGIWSELRLLGAIDRTLQIDLMRRCVGVLQPSLFEGWNTSLEEARFLGRPVIASAIPVHLEQKFAGVDFFEPHDDAALAALLSRAWGSAPKSGEIDFESEAAVRSEYGLLVREFGERFLELIAFASRPASG